MIALFRFTVRRMMVAVAVAAIVACGYATWLRGARLRGIAARHAEDRGWYEHQLARLDAGDTRPYRLDRDQIRAMSGVMDRQIAHHRAMKRKWVSAARYPWLPVAPDLPEPE